MMWIVRTTMYPNRAHFFIGFAITLSILTANISFTSPALASSKGGGSVIQEQVNTGNSNLDKEINKFYSCISKTHQDPPSIEKVDNCYSKTLGGTETGAGSSTSDSGVTGAGTSPTTSPHHHNK
jgi:hypothetical protein